MTKLLLILVVSLHTVANAKSSGADQTSCAALLQTIVRNSASKGDAPATLPNLLKLDLKKEQITQYYNLNRSTWLTQFDQRRLAAYIQTYLDDVPLTKEQSTDLKLMRALFKQVRFAFGMFDEGHAYPKFVDHFVKVMGELQDASMNNQTDLMKTKAREVEALLNGPHWSEFEKGLNAFEPSSGKNFRHYLNSQISFLEDNFQSSRVDEKTFHDMRKVLGRVLCLLNTINVLTPSPDTMQAQQFVINLYKRIGDLHDEYVAEEFHHSESRDHKIAIPDDVRAGLASIVRLFKASR